MADQAIRRAAIYARVSTTGQTVENQLLTLRAFAQARGWTVTEYVDHGISGSKSKRPGLDAMLEAAGRRQLDVVVAVKLDRLARSVSHLVGLGTELEALGVNLVVTDQAIDTTTPSGRLLFHTLAAIAEFERDLIRERVIAGLQRVKASGRRLGRPVVAVDCPRARRLLAEGRSYRETAAIIGVSPSTLHRAVQQTPSQRVVQIRTKAQRREAPG